jgi:hypothetical protein
LILPKAGAIRRKEKKLREEGKEGKERNITHLTPEG